MHDQRRQRITFRYLFNHHSRSLACRRNIAKKTVRIKTLPFQGDEKTSWRHLAAVRRYTIDHGISRDMAVRYPLSDLRQRRFHTATFMF